jgi:hypothetical protein
MRLDEWSNAGWGFSHPANFFKRFEKGQNISFELLQGLISSIWQ